MEVLISERKFNPVGIILSLTEVPNERTLPNHSYREMAKAPVFSSQESEAPRRHIEQVCSPPDRTLLSKHLLLLHGLYFIIQDFNF